MMLNNLLPGNTVTTMGAFLLVVLFGLSLAPALKRNIFSRRPTLMALLFIPLAIVLVLLFRMAVVQNYELNPDESDWISNANTLAVDPRYMVSTVMPLLITAPLLAIKSTIGYIDFYTIKVFAILIWIACFILLWGGLRNFFRSGLEFFVLLPLVLFMALMTYWDFVAYNSEHSPTLLFSIAVYLFSLTYKQVASKFTYPLLGIVLGSFLLSKIQMAPVAFVFALLVAADLIRKKNITTLIVFCVSGFLPITLVLLQVYLNNAMDIFVAAHKAALGYVAQGVTGEQTTWLDRMKGFRDTTNSLPDLFYYIRSYSYPAILTMALVIQGARAIDQRLRYLFIIQAIILTSVLGPALAIAVESLVYLGVCLYYASSFDDGFRRHLPVIGLSTTLMLTSFYTVVAPPTNFSHYYILSIIPVAFYSSVVLLSGTLFLNNATIKYSKGSIIIFFMSILVAMQSYALYTNRHTWFYHDKPSYTQRVNDAAITQTIRAWARPGERITVWGWSNKYYALSQTAMATRITFSFPQFLKGNSDIYWLELFLADMIKSHPVAIVDAIAPNQFNYEMFKDNGLDRHPRAKEFVDKYYTKVATIDGVRVYVSNARLKSRQTQHQMPM